MQWTERNHLILVAMLATAGLVACGGSSGDADADTPGLDASTRLDGSLGDDAGADDAGADDAGADDAGADDAGADDAGADDAGPADSGAGGCGSTTDCTAGDYCAFPTGACPAPDVTDGGTCTARPMDCPTVEAPVCGCDGSTYSNACVAAAGGVNVASEGACGDPGPSCTAMDAAGNGDCRLVLGLRWDGGRCEAISGCDCVGADCGSLYGVGEEAACERAYAGCASCAAQDAAGSGLCEAFFGYAWDGRGCGGLSGCECVGADCGAAYSSLGACEAAHAHCASTGTCEPDEATFEPGCGPAGGGAVLLDASGCYASCTGPSDSSCATGTCTRAWINPCVCPAGEICCSACGAEAWLCLPPGTGADAT